MKTCLWILILVAILSIVLIGKGKRVAMAIYSVGVICLFVLAYLAIHGSYLFGLSIIIS